MNSSLIQRNVAKLDYLPLGFWLATLAAVFFFFAIQVTFPLLPLFITDELGGSKSFIGTSVLIVAAFEVGFRLPVGGWSDRYGRRQFMIWGALLGVLYPALTALSHDTTLFILARVMHGLSLAVYITSSKAYIADIVPPERSGEAQGINTSAFALALIFGPLTGETLKNAFDFRVAFWVGAGFALVAWMILLLLPKTEQRATSTYSMMEGIKAVLKLRGGWAAIFTSLAGVNGFVMFFVYFPSYAEQIRLQDQVPQALHNFVISLAFSLFALVNLVAIPIAGRYSDQHGRTAVLIPGLLVTVPSIAFFALAKHYLLIYAAVLVISLGFSIYRAMMDALMQDACPRPLRGSGMAVLFSMWASGIGIQSQIYGWVIDTYSFGAMFALSGVVTFVCGVYAIWLSSRAERQRVTLYKGEFPPLPPA